jgi:hypothetical protein
VSGSNGGCSNLRANDRLPFVLRDRAICYSLLKKHEEATADFTKALEGNSFKKSDLAMVHVGRGLNRLAGGDLPGASEDCDVASNLSLEIPSVETEVRNLRALIDQYINEDGGIPS